MLCYPQKYEAVDVEDYVDNDEVFSWKWKKIAYTERERRKMRLLRFIYAWSVSEVCEMGEISEGVEML